MIKGLFSLLNVRWSDDGGGGGGGGGGGRRLTGDHAINRISL